MNDRDLPLIRATDIASALALLTRLPVPGADHKRGAMAAWAYPLAGLVVGAIAAIVASIALGLDLPPGLAAGLALAASILVTGAMHEDGLADSADGLWGGWDVARRLQIMKDSRIGTYGVLALVLSLGMRWSALATLFAAGFVAAPLLAAAVLSRAPMTAVMYALPHARTEGLSRSVGTPPRRTVEIAAILALVLGMICLGLGAITVALAICAATLVCALVANAKIGGQTGDILGAVQQVSEIAALATICAILL